MEKCRVLVGTVTCFVMGAAIMAGITMFSGQAQAETTDNACVNSFGGSERDFAHAVVSTMDNGYIVAGGTESFGAGAIDGYLLKFDHAGEKVWETTVGGSADEVLSDVLQTDDGGYAAFGYSVSYGSSRGKFYLVKLDDAGNLQWEKTYGHHDLTRGKTFMQTADGGFILGGQSTETDPWVDFRLTKVDAQGNEEWTRFFGREHDDSLYDILLTTDGGYLLIGMSGLWSSNVQTWIIKTDASGVQEWDLVWGGSADEWGYGGTLTLDGGYVITGLTNSYGAGDYDSFLLKVSDGGQVEWYKTYGGTEKDGGHEVSQKSNGQLIFTGFTNYSGDLKDGDAWIIETDNKGNLVSEQIFGENAYDVGTDLAVTHDGYILVGKTRSYGAGNSDVLVVTSPCPPSTPIEAALTVATAGNGVGNVTGNDINCGNGGSDCSKTYEQGTVVTLQATAAPDSVFDSWSVEECSVFSDCTITLDADMTVTATFTDSTVIPTPVPTEPPVNPTPPVNPSAVPEPGTLILLGLGLFGMLAVGKQKKKR